MEIQKGDNSEDSRGRERDGETGSEGHTSGTGARQRGPQEEPTSKMKSVVSIHREKTHPKNVGVD